MGAGAGDVTVGLDIGTTAVKAVAVDAGGSVLARARVPHDLRTPEPGSFEHDVDRAWRDGVLDALGAVAGSRDVAAVNVAAMVPSLGAVGAGGRATGPGLLYGDRRGERPAPGDEPAQPGDSGELLAFLAWHVAASPGAAGYWPAQAVANHALCGRGAIDTTTAMTAHPLFGGAGWDGDLAAAAGATVAQLPAIVAGPEPAGRVREGLPAAGALVGGGTIDALAEQMVAGADDPGDVLVLCGTTLITWGVLDGWREAPGLWTIPHTAAGRCLIGGPSNAGGLFLDAARRWLGPGAAAGVEDVGPADLPVWLPYVRGERTPLHRRDLRAALAGIALHHTPAHLLRAAYEAAGFVVRHHLDLARSSAGLAPRRIVATGGGTRVPAWMRALADCTGLPVDVAAVPEGAALGAAFLARGVAGLERSTAGASRWARTSHTVEPDPAWVAAAGERYERFRSGTRSAASRP
ncbi:MAG TPA: FGGY-family carbohydrate kinase [Actinomycetes bacterium]|nr:FGGY-family carbohydrate kinase [Actinomycetes bacterium]